MSQKLHNVVIFHNNCPDGFGALWLIRKYLLSSGLADENLENVDVVGGVHGEPPPDVPAGCRVWLLDFCYQATFLSRLSQSAAQVVLIDHHFSSVTSVQEWLTRSASEGASLEGVRVHASDQPEELTRSLKDPETQIAIVFSLDQSGCGLTARLCGEEAPDLAKHIEDYDLWHFDMPDTRALMCLVQTAPNSVPDGTRSVSDLGEKFSEWDALERDLRHRRTDTLATGRRLLRQKEKIVRDLAEACFWEDIAGHRVLVAHAPSSLGSEVAEVLAAKDPNSFAAYKVEWQNEYKYGLRSVTPTGTDVEAVARQFGGGGHKHSSAFRKPKEL